MITVEDFLFMEDKHKSSDYPDEGSVDKVSSFFSCQNKLSECRKIIINSTLAGFSGSSG